MGKMLKKRWVQIAACGFLVVTHLLFGWPVIQKWRLQKKYPIGTPLEEVSKQLQFPHSAIAGGPVFPDGVPTEEDKMLYSFFDLTIPEENVRLEFDYYRKLNGVLMINHPLVASWKKLTGQ